MAITRLVGKRIDDSIRGAFVIAAAIAVVAVGVLDLRREAAQMLSALAEEERVLASVVATSVKQAQALSEMPDEALALRLFGESAHDLRGLSLLLVAQPNRPGFIGRGGSNVISAPLEAALKQRRTTLELTRDDAIAFGLPHRAAVAGLHHWEGPGGTWTIAAVASAERERDRQRRALWRFVFATGLPAMLVGLFGFATLRQRQREQRLHQQVAQLEAQKERDALLSRAEKLTTVAAMLSGIGHEVASPLATIMMKAESLGDNTFARSIMEQTLRIQEIVQRFLAVARGQPPSMERIDSGALIDEACALVSHRFATAVVTLKCECDDVTLVCDRTLMRQAIVNLLLNACEASPSGSTVWLRGQRVGALFKVVVEDRGGGIEHGHEPELFLSTKRANGGIGLAVVDEIVKSHGGRLILTRVAEGGTQAIIEIAAMDEANHG